ncbi:carbohydrate ABC transporter permease [Limnochorda pilosa]|uniref:Sugar ABC transporter permease n=1 Tax=Limnochorda pilosa TaxID=1555112 RepID=A0A0K2SLJ1_LIMPI|nr:sugar ABC transporter permease [Limnochorda pilosa]BAS27877.1 sugar ABC transporter permease [Limnochorda pilosa]
MRFRTWADRATGYLFVLPDLLGLVVFVIAPAVLGLILSLFDWSGLGPMTFVGLSNYKTMFEDPIFLRSLGITFRYVAVFVGGNFVLAMALALLVQHQGRGIGFYRAVFFAPASISLVVVGFVWKFMFQPNGLINGLIKTLGFPGQPFLGSMSQALGVVLSLSFYLSAGYFMVILIAGLNDIPEQYYHAAMVDGATKLQQFWHVTLPLLKPTSFFVLVMSILQGFQVFDQIYVLTGGGPFYATTTTVFYAFQSAFRYYQFGYASAITVVIFAIQVALSVVLFRLLKGGRVA